MPLHYPATRVILDAFILSSDTGYIGCIYIIQRHESYWMPLYQATRGHIGCLYNIQRHESYWMPLHYPATRVILDAFILSSDTSHIGCIYIIQQHESYWMPLYQATRVIVDAFISSDTSHIGCLYIIQ